MFKQAKSAIFWYYLYKFRKRVTFIVFLLLIAIFTNFIYSDVVQYLQLKQKLQYLEIVLILKWVIILSSITLSAYLLLTLFKKDEENKQKEKSKNIKKEEVKTKEEKKEEASKFTSREEMFLYKDTLNNKADKLVKR